jgi:DNA repair protein RecO (recombination protein O)
MIQSATGLILRTRPLTETSLIVHWLTSAFGRIATVAKGARRPKSPFLGRLDLFYEAEFTFSRSRSSELHTLREIRLRKIHSELRQELHYLRQAAYCAALIEQTTETETPLPAVYELMRGFLSVLPGRPALPQTVFAFELKLLGELGLSPDTAKSRLSAGSTAIASRLKADNWPSVFRLKLSDAQVAELSQFLHGFLIFHLGRIPRHRTAAIAP